jgi:Fur family transcriptional regulator, ferric uptake regulator
MMKTRKQRMTPQRKRILDELCSRCDHPTAEEIYGAVRKALPRISLGTVYRNLDVLVRKGEVTRIECAGEQARFDADTRTHYHVKCVSCGRVDDVEAEPPEEMLLPGAQAPGYAITGVRVEYTGVCASCRRTSTDS